MEGLTDSLRAATTAAPPTRIDLDQLIRGERRRRTRWSAALAVGVLAGGSAVALAALNGLPSVAPSGPTPIATTTPAPETCAAFRVTVADDGLPTNEAAVRLTCYLLDAVPPRLANDARLGPNELRRTAALVAGTGGMGSAQEVTATATVVDSAGTGSIIFAVDKVKREPAVEQSHCQEPHAKAACRTGPHGEHIEIFDFGKDSNGIHGRTVYVYSGSTRILAGAHNYVESTSDNPQPTRDEPPLTADELIEIATAPELAFYH